MDEFKETLIVPGSNAPKNCWRQTTLRKYFSTSAQGHKKMEYYLSALVGDNARNGPRHGAFATMRESLMDAPNRFERAGTVFEKTGELVLNSDAEDDDRWEAVTTETNYFRCPPVA